MAKLAYQLQVNGAKHLIQYEPDGKHFRYIPFIPNLDIPTIQSKKLEWQTRQPSLLSEREFANKKNCADVLSTG